ncbi:hypothetical protein TOPH_08368 [Tolypocladium ophioglossoides CBS 100239]|uniref:Fungal N-terminal domain-containing protein n=1 Tax=Tolypocladium ophioglossoides (strain CBS 100239) TaxID=1163406 RepID=A0A0L0MZW8_TOLOC|nr:hypothetical protein TOPH_08368 [Tolypocladium ophioglossoides CBS 100239]
MGEKLSVTTAIIGLLAVGGRTIDTIWDLNLPATPSTPILVQALQELKQCRSTVHILYKTFSLLESARLPFPERGTWIEVDDLIATLTDTVLAFSELQALCAALDLQRQALATADYDQRIGGLPGEADAQNARVGLERRMTRLLTSNAVLASRMRQLDDVFDGRALDRESLPHYTRRPVPSASPLSGGEPEITPAEAGEVGPEGRSRVPSPLSGYTLADIPVLSIIPLPVTTDELHDGNEFYTFAYARRVGRDLGELMQYQASQGTSRALSILLGRTNANSNGGSTSSTGSSNEECPPVAVDAHAPPTTKKPRFRRIRVKCRWRATR